MPTHKISYVLIRLESLRGKGDHITGEVGPQWLRTMPTKWSLYVQGQDTSAQQMMRLGTKKSLAGGIWLATVNSLPDTAGQTREP